MGILLVNYTWDEITSFHTSLIITFFDPWFESSCWYQVTSAQSDHSWSPKTESFLQSMVNTTLAKRILKQFVVQNFSWQSWNGLHYNRSIIAVELQLVGQVAGKNSFDDGIHGQKGGILSSKDTTRKEMSWLETMQLNGLSGWTLLLWRCSLMRAYNNGRKLHACHLW